MVSHAPSSRRTFEQWLECARPTDAELEAEVEKDIAEDLRWARSEEEHQEYLRPETRQSALELIIVNRARKAAEALRDFPERATPAMLEKLRTGNARERLAAARTLIRLRQEYRIEIDEATGAAIAQNCPNFIPSLVR